MIRLGRLLLRRSIPHVTPAARVRTIPADTRSVTVASEGRTKAA